MQYTRAQAQLTVTNQPIPRQSDFAGHSSARQDDQFTHNPQPIQTRIPSEAIKTIACRRLRLFVNRRAHRAFTEQIGGYRTHALDLNFAARSYFITAIEGFVKGL